MAIPAGKPSRRPRNTKAKNDYYVRYVSGTLRGLATAQMVAVTTGMFKAALANTYQDAGRAAYNWHIKAGDNFEGPVRVYDQPPIGSKGEARGTGHRTVIDYKHKQYGVKGKIFPAVSSFLVDAVGDPYERAGPKKRQVAVYNPIWDEETLAYKYHAEAAFINRGDVREAMNLEAGRQVAFLQALLKERRERPEGWQALLRKVFGFLSKFKY